jgi:ribosomal-protein-alanine N-acetyltransferase
MIKGEKVYLTELDWANSETIRGWLNDPEVHEYLFVGHTPITREEERQYFEAQAAETDRHTFEIHSGDDGRYLGYVGLKDMHPVHRRAELGLSSGGRTIGEGLRADAIVTCLRYGFDTLGLHTVKVQGPPGPHTRPRAIPTPRLCRSRQGA